MEKTELLEVIISKDNRAFKYRFNDVSIEGGEVANEIAIFKANQIQNPPKTVDELLRSGGTQWFYRIAALIFTEYKDFAIENKTITGTKLPFDFDKADYEIKNWFSQLSIDEKPKIKMAIEDFFLNTGLGHLNLILFRKQERLDIARILSTQIANTLKKSIEEPSI